MKPAVMAVERAAAVYQQEACSRTFREDLEAHLLHGFVFSRPDYFVMGRPVIKDSPRACIVNALHSYKWEECDCWHVYLFAGNVVRGLALIPWELPWISFERRNDLRFYRLGDIQRLSGQFPETL